MTNVPNQPDRWRLPYEDTLDACIGLEIDELVEVGVRTGRLPVVPGVCQPMGTADGVIELGKLPLGMSNNTSFLRPVSGGSVHARAEAFHRGRTSWVWDVEMRNDDGKLCATSRVTIAVRDPQ